MATMTWDEFKKEVERQMEQGGLSPDTKIEYIEITRPDQSHPMTEIIVDGKDGWMTVNQ